MAKSTQAADGTKAGQQVTKNLFTDSHPYEVVEVLSPRTILCRLLDFKVVKGGMHDGSAEFTYHQNPENPTVKVSLRKDGKWRTKGEDMKGIPWSMNGARKYYDPHF